MATIKGYYTNTLDTSSLKLYFTSSGVEIAKTPSFGSDSGGTFYRYTSLNADATGYTVKSNLGCGCTGPVTSYTQTCYVDMPPADPCTCP